MSDNVYRKLQRCRAELRKKEIKESGNNKFAGYTYMELGDFLPHIIDLCNENGLCTVVSFTPEEATLTVVNSDAPEERVVFTSPMSTAELKGCHAIQNLGAVETYLRRYLYVAAFDIVEHDALDATHGKETKTETPAARAPKPQNTPSQPAATQTQGQLSTEQAKYFPRVLSALDILFGTDVAAKKGKIKELTTFPGRDGKLVIGVEDYRKLDGKRLEILTHKLEKEAEALKTAPLPEVCAECGEPRRDGACRNLSCPEGRPEEDPEPF